LADDVGVYDWSGIVIALLAVGILALAMRWVFRPSRPRTGLIVDAADARELGLLQVIAAGLSRPEALRRQAVLADAGIRASISRRRDGGTDLLVFSDDVDRARSALGA
jgi:hypothetical protein